MDAPSPRPKEPCSWKSIPRSFGAVLFSWVTPLVMLGYKRPLVATDMKAMPEKETSVVLYSKFCR